MHGREALAAASASLLVRPRDHVRDEFASRRRIERRVDQRLELLRMPQQPLHLCPLGLQATAHHALRRQSEICCALACHVRRGWLSPQRRLVDELGAVDHLRRQLVACDAHLPPRRDDVVRVGPKEPHARQPELRIAAEHLDELDHPERRALLLVVRLVRRLVHVAPVVVAAVKGGVVLVEGLEEARRHGLLREEADAQAR
eukprot:7384512-Prymnesium_polylepis.2